MEQTYYLNCPLEADEMLWIPVTAKHRRTVSLYVAIYHPHVCLGIPSKHCGGWFPKLLYLG